MASPLTDRALVFAGFMGAGKTVAARVVGAAWGMEPIDTDALLEREIGVGDRLGLLSGHDAHPARQRLEQVRVQLGHGAVGDQEAPPLRRP